MDFEREAKAAEPRVYLTGSSVYINHKINRAVAPPRYDELAESFPGMIQIAAAPLPDQIIPGCLVVEVGASFYPD